jgi:hypothetical protein
MTKKRKSRSPTEEERAAALAELLMRPEATWAEAMSLLARWPDAPGRSAALAAVEASGRWAPEDRGLTPLVVQQLRRGETGPHLCLIRDLDLRLVIGERRRDRLFEQMIKHGGVSRLHTFTTRYDYWGDQLVALIVRHISGLRRLMIGSSAVGDESARALGAAPSLAGLVQLSLYSNRLTDAGAANLVESPYLRRLRTLNLYDNMLSPAMVARLRAAPQWQGATLILHRQRPGEGWVDDRIPPFWVAKGAL